MMGDSEAMKMSYSGCIQLGLFEETEDTLLAHELGWNAAVTFTAIQNHIEEKTQNDNQPTA